MPRIWSYLLLILLWGIGGERSTLQAQAEPEAALLLQEIHFQGNSKSKRNFLLRFLQCQVGTPISLAVVATDEQALRNLQLFTRIESRLDTLPEGIHLTFELEEVFTIFPIVDVGGVKGNRYLQLGALDYHWLGARGLIGGSYRYDGRHSQQAMVSYPYFRNTAWGGSFSALHLATTEPLFFQDNRINYLYDNLTLEALARREFQFGHFAQFGGAFLRESFLQRDSSELEVPEAATLNKLILKGTHTYQRLNWDSHYVSGIANELLLESVLTFRYQDWFWKVLNQFRYYHRVGKKGNLATRVRIGISPDINSPFVPFVLDSYLNIRGSGNRVARGTGELVWNAEYRHTLWEDGRYGAVQFVGFLDWGTWRTLEIKGRDMFLPENMVLFYGGGVRLYVPKAAHLILRADYGIRFGNAQESGLVLGVGQYF